MKHNRSTAPHPGAAGGGPGHKKPLLLRTERDFYRLPELEVRGGVVSASGCRRVLAFTPEKIVMDAGSTLLVLYGAALQIESLSGQRLTVTGKLQKLEFRHKWEAPDA